MTHLVTGARGAVARAVIDQLLAAGQTVRAASAAPTETSLPEDVEVVGLDLTDPASVAAALQGIERVFLYAAHEDIGNFITAAQESGIQHLVLLSSIAAEREGNPIGDHHLSVERPLQESGLPLTILRPGAFATNARMWASSIKAERIVRLPFPDIHQNPIHEADLAGVAITALTEPGHAGKIYPLTGPESLPQRRIIELIATALDEPIELVELTYEQAVGIVYQPVLDMWAKASAGPTRVGPTSESVTGKPARTFAQWAVDHLADFA